jgi:chlorobactene glucosyltransferase
VKHTPWRTYFSSQIFARTAGAPAEWVHSGLGLGPGLSPWVAVVVAFGIAAFLIKSRLNYLSMPALAAQKPAPTPPDCMVVIPARNEEASIARAVRSFPPDTVIVVDDCSKDGTVAAASKAGAGVLRGKEPPRGVIGKSFACMAGARVLTSKWVLFTDADTWYAPGFLDAAIACAEANELLFLSIYPRFECGGFAEHVLVPFAVALYFTGVNPRRDPLAGFNGQCVLVRREAYEFIGGHAVVQNNVMDDVKLAGLAQRHRLKFAVVRAPGIAHVRMQPSGFERGAFRFMLVNPWIGATILMAAFTIALCLPVLAWLILEHQWAVAAVFTLVPITFLTPWYRNPLRALVAPLAVYGMMPILLRGLFTALAGREVEWKGRTV